MGFGAVSGEILRRMVVFLQSPSDYMFEINPGLHLLLGLPDSVNLLDGAPGRRLTSASRWESERIQACH